MAERHRSKDGTRETEAFLHDEPTPGGQGETGGTLARTIGARADERKATDPDAGVPVRVRKSDTPGG
ncbi:hypothetical protein [Rubellimicrobium sp. CFH 75288]|uniref:hypothetical protein n=1 Tax=Rubellimicrobium sp. CFH 75288 TaxID=2697034 RepID=UPI001411EC52|nr:hypothetical protein [Rubellimicrobium sp. CFH 75288]NAZ35577.1 hypothetical protein [Rubellimicrobium sp. CFH 75288]